MVHAAFLLAADNVVLAADKMKLLSHGFAQTASLRFLLPWRCLGKPVKSGATVSQCWTIGTQVLAMLG